MTDMRLNAEDRFSNEVREVANDIIDLLVTKNAQYGDSALNPLQVFATTNPAEQLNVRIDDKLSRIKRGDGTGDEDAELDLIGYLMLKQILQKRESAKETTDAILALGPMSVRNLRRGVREEQVRQREQRIRKLEHQLERERQLKIEDQ